MLPTFANNASNIPRSLPCCTASALREPSPSKPPRIVQSSPMVTNLPEMKKDRGTSHTYKKTSKRTTAATATTTTATATATPTTATTTTTITTTPAAAATLKFISTMTVKVITLRTVSMYMLDVASCGIHSWLVNHFPAIARNV